jgi:hypothetical protein
MIIRKELNFINVVGEGWLPPGVPIAMSLDLRQYDIDNICRSGGWNRDSVEQWLHTHAGDFSVVHDFFATCKDWEDIQWGDEDYEMEFNDLTGECE